MRSDTREGWARATELFGQVAQSHPDQPYGHVLSAFASWIVTLFGTDAGALPSVRAIDYVVFPAAAAITLYLTLRLFGGFITGLGLHFFFLLVLLFRITIGIV